MSQQEHPNVALVREGFEAFASNDTDWIAKHVADDVVWNIGGRSKLAGSYKGKQEITEVFERQAAVMANSKIETHDIVGNDRHVIAIGTATAQDPAGGSVEWRWANVFHVRDGKITEVWGLSEDPSEIDALIDKLV
ncbi:MAG TPA: nuclear transport factor 2 family protein [Actinomycetota bacterium]|jgi:ketosteroid isomerase-like protein|nr:nuclear transport factor 2 family protein [Actinomycetota bacterium]